MVGSMKGLEKRVSVIEAKRPQAIGRWHRFLWGVGQTWAQVLAAHNDGVDVQAGDHVILCKVVAAENGCRVPDPVMDSEGPVASAWLTERGVR